ncbi:MAG: hypothetical protein HQ557_17175 [Bacteroidetes bacterium]|nr:hypothetical protein [Bacteroidota bacterium]
MKRTILISISILLISLVFGSCAFFSFKPPATDASRSVTPTVYKIAVINLELMASGGSTSVNIINEGPETAEIIDILPGTALLTGETTLEDAINAKTLGDGTTYDEYLMEPLYIEMELTAAFHFHATCTESGFSLEFGTDGDEAAYAFRLYFNPVDNLWKRDLLVHLSSTQIGAGTLAASYPDGWYWMRRAIEPGGSTNFLILAQEDGVTYDNTNGISTDDFPEHPASDIGSTSTIDLFANDTFWGDPANYDDYATDTVEIDTFSDVGELRADWDAFTFAASDIVTVTADIADSFNFWYETDPAKIDFTAPLNLDVIDLGPDYDNPAVSGDEEKLGDWGFHPFLPVFTTSSSAP